MVLTSAATSLRMSFAILVPSRILAGIRAPGFGFRASARKSYTDGPAERRRGFDFEYNAPVMIAKDLLEILVCPACKQALEYRENPESLKCKQCHRVYAVKDDIPIMLVDEAKIEA